MSFIIWIDEREIYLYDKCQELSKVVSGTGLSPAIIIKKKVLPLGDVEVCFSQGDQSKTVCIVERKTITDLLASVKDGRYEEQSYRLIHASGIPPRQITYVIEGMMSISGSDSNKALVYSCMTSLQLFKGFSIVRTIHLTETAEWLLYTVSKIQKNYCKKMYLWKEQTSDIHVGEDGGTADMVGMQTPSQNGNIGYSYSTVVKKCKKENITPENLGEIMLCQIPGINSASAKAIMTQFGNSILELLKELEKNPNCLEEIFMVHPETKKKRKLNANIIKNIKEYLLAPVA